MPMLEKGATCLLKSCFCGLFPQFEWIAIHLCARLHLGGSNELKAQTSWSMHGRPQH